MSSPKQFLNLNNFKRIWRLIAITFARQDYAEYLDRRIAYLESVITTDYISDHLTTIELNVKQEILDRIQADEILNEELTNLQSDIKQLQEKINQLEKRSSNLNVHACKDGCSYPMHRE